MLVFVGSSVAIGSTTCSAKLSSLWLVPERSASSDEPPAPC
jgi:hypothetical protein